MLPSNIKDLYKNLISTAGLFKSPAYKSFFTRKIESDYDDIKKNNSKCKIKKYVEEQSDLLDTLKRQTVIYNMFYDDKSGI